MPVIAGPTQNQVNQLLVDREVKTVHGIVQLPVLWLDVCDGNGANYFLFATVIGDEVRELEGIKIGRSASSWVKKQVLARYKKSAAHAVNETATVVEQKTEAPEMPTKKSSLNVLGGKKK